MTSPKLRSTPEQLVVAEGLAARGEADPLGRLLQQ